MLLPDPKLLHEGRHAVIRQTHTQHIPLRGARFAHQEGLWTQRAAHEVGTRPAGVQRRVCVCVCTFWRLSVCGSDPGRFPLQDVQRSRWIDGQLKPDGNRQQEAVQHADALQGAPASVVRYELAPRWLSRLREIIERFLLLCHLQIHTTCGT